MINVTANTASRDSTLRRDALDKRLDKLEADNHTLMIQVGCLRKQILDIEGKKSYVQADAS